MGRRSLEVSRGVEGVGGDSNGGGDDNEGGDDSIGGGDDICGVEDEIVEVIGVEKIWGVARAPAYCLGILAKAGRGGGVETQDIIELVGGRG